MAAVPERLCGGIFHEQRDKEAQCRGWLYILTNPPQLHPERPREGQTPSGQPGLPGQGFYIAECWCFPDLLTLCLCQEPWCSTSALVTVISGLHPTQILQRNCKKPWCPVDPHTQTGVRSLKCETSLPPCFLWNSIDTSERKKKCRVFFFFTIAVCFTEDFFGQRIHGIYKNQ